MYEYIMNILYIYRERESKPQIHGHSQHDLHCNDFIFSAITLSLIDTWFGLYHEV